MSELAAKECQPCKGGVPPLDSGRIAELLQEVQGWRVEHEFHLTREFSFSDFKSALDFVNAVGAIAEQQQHHPDIYLAWGKVKVEIWTHKINGLTESDFILAAKVDEVLN